MRLPTEHDRRTDWAAIVVWLGVIVFVGGFWSLVYFQPWEWL